MKQEHANKSRCDERIGYFIFLGFGYVVASHSFKNEVNIIHLISDGLLPVRNFPGEVTYLFIIDLRLNLFLCLPFPYLTRLLCSQIFAR
jgi:hypothetical protein